MKTRVYVDGFNLYYGAVKGTPFKWLDPVRLTRLLLPDEYTIDKLLYFTARVSGKIDRRAPARQHAHLNALRTLPETEMHFGNFLGKTIWRPLTNLPVAERRIDTPQEPVTLPAGNHPVADSGRKTLPVGSYPEHVPGNNRRGTPHQTTAGCRGSPVLRLRRKGVGCQSRGPSPERRVARPVRGGRRDIERHRSRNPDPDGGLRAGEARLHRVPGALAGRPEAETGRQLREARPARTAARRTVSGPPARHPNLEADQLVNSRPARSGAWPWTSSPLLRSRATSVARAFADRRRGPSTATWAGFGLAILIAILTWLATSIDANRDRIDAVGERITGVETRLSERLSTFETSVSERLTRIETLLEERLPERR